MLEGSEGTGCGWKVRLLPPSSLSFWAKGIAEVRVIPKTTPLLATLTQLGVPTLSSGLITW